MTTENEKPGAAGTADRVVIEAPGEVRRHFMSACAQPSTPPSPDLVLSRLERVRKAGTGYTARCPAHEDRTASLSVTSGNDGRLLVHCFAGCAIGDVLAAIGLMVSDMFPQRLKDASPEARCELQGLALRANLQACASLLDFEASVLLVAAGDLDRGRALSDADHARLALAAKRIHAARVAIGGVR